MSRLEFDAGVITALTMVFEKDLTQIDMQDYLDMKIANFKKTHGIEVYDKLEGFIQR